MHPAGMSWSARFPSRAARPSKSRPRHRGRGGGERSEHYLAGRGRLGRYRAATFIEENPLIPGCRRLSTSRRAADESPTPGPKNSKKSKGPDSNYPPAAKSDSPRLTANCAVALPHSGIARPALEDGPNAWTQAVGLYASVSRFFPMTRTSRPKSPAYLIAWPRRANSSVW